MTDPDPEVCALAQRLGITDEELRGRFEAIPLETSREIFRQLLKATDATYEALAVAGSTMNPDLRREIQDLTRQMVELAVDQLDEATQ